MRYTATLLTTLACTFTTAQAAELNIAITSSGQDTIVVEPGATVDYEVTGVLTDTANEGLSFFIFDLAFDGGPLDAADNPLAMPLTNFTPPEGFTNPEGYGGAVIDGVVHQVGGSQNTLKSPLMSGSVITGLGHRPIVLATGTLTAPMTDGAYTLTASEVLGRVIEQGADGSGETWATAWAFEGDVAGLQVLVGPECTSIADCADLDGDLIRDENCVYWQCIGGLCVGTDTVFGDMGISIAHPDECVANQATDGGDAGLALTCFGGSADCEDNPPAAYNIDAAGPFSCVPDGVCDLHDVFQALAAFGGFGTCVCESDPMPQAPGDISRVRMGIGNVRLFMAPEGMQDEVASIGNTTLFMEPGESVRVMIWLEDLSSTGDLLTGYQLVFPRDASPLPAATGSVNYIDNNPGFTGGDSVFIDFDRPDWVFSGSIAIPPPVYAETVHDGFGLAFKTAIPLDDVDPAVTRGIHYLGEFEVSASPDASGQFNLAPLTTPTSIPRPLTALFAPGGLEPYVVDELQPLTIVIGEPDCESVADCADLDANGIRDDNCVWWACGAGVCQGTDIVFADMAGQFGDCLPDGTADSNDRFAALNCFTGYNADGVTLYDCEDSAPTAFNVDTGGAFGNCNPDGVCDANDAYHAINVFAGINTCIPTCSAGPTPDVNPIVTSRATIELRPTKKQLHPGDTIAVEVFLSSPLDDLRGYQLHLGVAGGTRGQLELVDVSVHRRWDAVFADQTAWTAFNVKTGQMLAGLDSPGIRTNADAYLATFTWRVSRDAVGPFRIELLHDVADASQRTFLFSTDQRAVTEIEVEPVVVDVVADREHGRVR